MPDIDYKFSANYALASLTIFNRLELAPRSEDFGRSLRAEVRDALWMLTRQWQFGEFTGEDAGTPVSAKILGRHSTPDRLSHLDYPPTAFDPLSVPLESAVEQEAPSPDLWLRVQMGRYFQKMLQTGGLSRYLPLFQSWYPLPPVTDVSDSEGISFFYAVEGLGFDGWQLYDEYVPSPADYEKWIDRDDDIAAADKPALKQLLAAFRDWYGQLYQQPAAGQSAWDPERLEYRFALHCPASAGQEGTLPAAQYVGGHLDWYSMDERAAPPNAILPHTEHSDVFVPQPVTFRGMPHPRFWQMEDRRLDFGKLSASPTGLLNLLLAEYGLIYSNDWFVTPYSLGINTLCEIAGIRVTDIFGQHFFIGPSLQDPETKWQELAFFHQTEIHNAATPRNRFYLAPSVGKVQEGEPVEAVRFLRDEMANLVWAVETRAPSAAGGSFDARLAAQLHTATEPPLQPGFDNVSLRYVLGTTVPANWFPFIPVLKPGSTTEIMLQRARLPQSPGPKGRLLTEVKAPYLIHEEEIPRSGIQVERAYQRTRWLNGQVVCWLGRRKTAGGGEGWSGLVFDQVENR